jgi:hypothetical protein
MQENTHYADFSEPDLQCSQVYERAGQKFTKGLYAQ